MIMLDVFGILVILMQSYRIEYWTLYIGRFLLGIYVGISSGIIPVYLISISPPEISGIVGSFNQLLITMGIACAYGLG
jgi:SP family sugar:H+ symporter-like MFS transporter